MPSLPHITNQHKGENVNSEPANGIRRIYTTHNPELFEFKKLSILYNFERRQNRNITLRMLAIAGALIVGLLLLIKYS